jgi:negative regulator of replication initiation
VKGTYKGTAKQTLEVGVSVSFEDKALFKEVSATLTPQSIPNSAFGVIEEQNSYQKYMQMIQQQQ